MCRRNTYRVSHADSFSLSLSLANDRILSRTVSDSISAEDNFSKEMVITDGNYTRAYSMRVDILL